MRKHGNGIRNKIICYVLALGMILTSTSFQDVVVQAAVDTQENGIIEGEYTTGVFAGEYGIDQLFDYIMSSGRLNDLPYDASWGHANSSYGHQLNTRVMKNRYFVLKHSGDKTYPIALCLYENDGTPVVAGRSANLLSESKVGVESNVNLTNTAKNYMDKHYADGIEGVMALCKMGKADQNGLYFSSKNGFGYYLSGNQGRDVGETIRWVNADTNVTMDELAAMENYSSHSLTTGEYAVMYQSNGTAVRNMPGEQKKIKGSELALSEKVPVRKGYRFAEWNTKEDGSGKSYQPGDVYTDNAVLTLYAVWSRYYESGLFGAKFGNSQFFDNITSANRINGNPYDSSWGIAHASTGHQYSDAQVKDRYFIFRYSGDSSYPVALFMYEKDGTPVVAGKSGQLPASSQVGLKSNVCLTAAGKEYMEDQYEDGIKGLICQGTVSKYDDNGVQFISKNLFGYYISGNRGYKKGDYISWSGAVTNNITVDALDAIETFSDSEMSVGEYSINYNCNTADAVTNMPDTQRKEDLYNSLITLQQPERDGYDFAGWDTKKDGSGDRYEAGARYEGEKSLTLYAIWEKTEKNALVLQENDKNVAKNYQISNESKIKEILEQADNADEFYSKMNDVDLIRYLTISGGAGEEADYKAVSSEPEVVESSVEDNILTLIGKKNGFSYVTVTDKTSGQMFRLSVTVKTLQDSLYIIRPVTADSYKAYLTESNKVSYSVRSEIGKKVKWEKTNKEVEQIKQLSNGDAIVWKPKSQKTAIGVTCGVNQVSVALEGMESGENTDSYPINVRPVSSTYHQNVTLSDAAGQGEETPFTVKAYLVDLDGNVIAKTEETVTKALSKKAETVQLGFENVEELTDADTVLEVTAGDGKYEPQLIRYPVYRKGEQKNNGTAVVMKPATDTDASQYSITASDAEGKKVSNLVIQKGDTKEITVYSGAAQKHSVVMVLDKKEIKASSEQEVSLDGMTYCWNKTVYTINSKDTETGRYTPQMQLKEENGTILMAKPASFTVSNISDLTSPQKPTQIDFIGSLETPKLTAGDIFNKNLKFDLPKVLPMKIDYQDTADPFKKTFMIAIGNAGLDENNVTAAVTDLINDLRDNNVSKSLSGYAFGTADYVNGKWVLNYTGGGIAGTLGYEFNQTNTVFVGWVPVYYGIKVGCTLKVDGLLSGQNVYHNKFVGMKFSTNNLSLTSEYDFVSDVLVGVQGYIGASGGIGFDVKVAKLKFGVEGNLSLEYNHRLVTFKDLDRTKNYYGSCLNFSGDIGLCFEFKILFVKYKKRIVGKGFNKLQTYKDWSAFPDGRPNLLEFAGMQNSEKLSVVKFSSPNEDTTDWRKYVNPYTTPVLAADGQSMGLSYTNNLDDLSSIDPAVSTKKDGEWTKPEALTSWRTLGKSETINSVDYDTDGSLRVLAFDSVDYDENMMEDGAVDNEEFNKSANSTEIHTYVGEKHTRLTNNKQADTAPVVAVKNGKAVIVWQSDTYDLDDVTEETLQKDMCGEKKLCYSYYDGTDWSEPEYLENGQIKGVQSYDVALSDDGTAMVLATMGTSEKVQERELYSYIIVKGKQKNVNRITCNESGETQPRVKYVTDNGGMFLAGWQQSKYKDNKVQEQCVVFQGYHKDGSASSVSLKDNGEVAENFDFAKGGDTIKDSAVYWQAMGEDSLTHTFVKYMNESAHCLSMKYEMDSTTSSSEAMVGASVAVDGDDFTAVSGVQTQPSASETEEMQTEDENQNDEAENPARLLFSSKKIFNTLSEVSASALGQNIEPNSNIRVTLSFLNAGRKAMNGVDVKQGDNTIASDLPIHLESGESGQVSFQYSLGAELKNEKFDLVADNGAKAEVKLTLLGADLVVGTPDVVDTLSGGERIVQVILSNAGTKALKEDDTIKLALTGVDQKELIARPITESSLWDEEQKKIVVSGKDAMEAVNRGDYVLQFAYKPEYQSDMDSISVSLQANAYNGSQALDELNLLDNIAVFSIIKPSQMYDTQLTYRTVMEEGTINALCVTNQYETPVEKSIMVSNGAETKQINVVLAGEESKTYLLGLDAAKEIFYEEKDIDGEESPTAKPSAKPTAEPSVEPTTEPSVEPTAEPSVEPTAEPSVEPTAEPSVEPTAEPSVEPTAKPSVEPTAKPTVKPTAKPTVKPTASAKPTVKPTVRPIASAKPTVKPTVRPIASAKPTVKPILRPTAKPTIVPIRKTVIPSERKLVVAKASIKAVKNKASRKLVLMIKPVLLANGYRVQYSIDKKFRKAVTKWTRSRKLTIKKLKKKKTYYIRVSAYRIDSSGNKVLGAYSKIKKVKIKK